MIEPSNVIPDSAVLIPARGGSTGIVGKNLLLLSGRPLLAHAIQTAQRSRAENVYVTTDSPEIAQVAAHFGARVITRPPELAADDTSTEATVLHALEQLPANLQRLAIVQCTSPVTTAGDVTRCLLELDEHDCAFTVAPSHAFVWTERGGKWEAETFLPTLPRQRRQDGEQWVETGGVYAVRVPGFREARRRFFGRWVGVKCSMRLEIDEPQDVPLARWFLRQRIRPPTLLLGSTRVGGDCAPYLVAEIGVNHLGDLNRAKRLVTAAKVARFNAVKFQARTPELCVPRDQWEQLRPDPWNPGQQIRYIDYRQQMEFSDEQWRELVEHCHAERIDWFASCWDHEALERIDVLDPVAHKVPSACVTDHALLRATARTMRPVILSTGMSSLRDIDAAIGQLHADKLVLLHSTSAYPCPTEALNLRAIGTLYETYGVPCGYSGHEAGLVPSIGAAALGASVIERHVTLDRSDWGSDQACSLEPHEMELLAAHVREVWQARGSGRKSVHDVELPAMSKLRRIA